MNSKLKEIFGPNFNLADIDFVQPPSSLAILNSVSLETNKTVKALKSELEQFYVERKRPPDRQLLHSSKSNEWKEHFYHALQALLNELMFTTSSRIKNQLLNKINKWYMDKTGRSPIQEKIKYLHDFVEEQEDLVIYIPQKIEPKKPVEKSPMKRLQNTCLSKPLKYSEDDHDSENFFEDLLNSEANGPSSFLPKVKAPRDRDNFIRPFSPEKASVDEFCPEIKDFRSHSRAKSTGVSRGFSPQTLRNTSYNTRFTSTNMETSEFSAVPNIRRIQIREVMNIKKRLASRKVICPVKVLEGGLVISDFTLDRLPVENLPKGGELLMQDPTAKKKGSKKKRKKGKKK